MSEVAQNLRWLCDRAGLDRTKLAEATHIDRTVISKILSGKRPPTSTQLLTLAKHFDVLDPDELKFSHDTFVETYKAADSNLLLRSFRAVRSHLPRLQSIYESYRGQYGVYYSRASGKDDERLVVASLLDVHRLTREAIEFRFINPHKLPTGEWSIYDYSGFLFPIGETLFLLAEQKDNDYEVLTILIQMSHGPQVRLLKGLMSGVGVKTEEGAERHWIAARPVVLHKRRTRIESWRSSISQELGFLQETKLPEFVRRQLSYERVDLSSDRDRGSG
jgi:transcriptional regulator with XRE-family HTH domain